MNIEHYKMFALELINLRVHEINGSGILAQKYIIHCTVICFYNSPRLTFSRKVDPVNSSQNLF